MSHIEELFDAYVNPVLEYVGTKCKEFQAIPEIGKVNSLLKMYEKMLQDYDMFDRQYIEKYKPDVICNKLDILFIYCVIWTLAGTIDENGRQNFHKFYKNMIREPQKCQTKKDKLIRFDKQVIIPEGGSKILIYDYFIEKSEFKWKKWSDHLLTVDENTDFFNIYYYLGIEIF